MALLLSGGPVAAAIRERSKKQADILGQAGITPCLALVCVGERPDALSYAGSLTKNASNSGVSARLEALPESISQGEAAARLRLLNQDPAVHGILLLRPLPSHLDENALCQLIAPEKDVDCATDLSLAGVFTDKALGFPPATPRAVMEILHHYNIPLKGKKAVVLGRSLVVGRPLAMMLMGENATVTLCHSQTEDLTVYTRQADIIVAALGKARALGADKLGRQQILIDVGIHRTEEGLCGDIDFAQAEPLAAAITPVPGGVGAVTTAVLLQQVVEAAARTLS